MKVIDFTEQQIKDFVEHKRPKDKVVRDQLDIGYKYDGRSLEIQEIRPQWDDSSIIHQYPIAKATFVKSKKIWKLYWKRASGKWEPYTPMPEIKSIQEVLQAIGDDTHHCFWG
ncbi:DUF3024 domain-containing protein [Aquimarina sp. I32.4]|uniref:DUF3024 domain-containing protein n=1 Tax=Aquimarina sp. I32.4 TaxID=2053903 RepID=UPI000CDEE0FB|nr:DUF3024 domain-containing protein [Aquimarina sp. I32.4]